MKNLKYLRESLIPSIGTVEMCLEMWTAIDELFEMGLINESQMCELFSETTTISILRSLTNDISKPSSKKSPRILTQSQDFHDIARSFFRLLPHYITRLHLPKELFLPFVTNCDQFIVARCFECMLLIHRPSRLFESPLIHFLEENDERTTHIHLTEAALLIAKEIAEQSRIGRPQREETDCFVWCVAYAFHTTNIYSNPGHNYSQMSLSLLRQTFMKWMVEEEDFERTAEWQSTALNTLGKVFFSPLSSPFPNSLVNMYWLVQAMSVLFPPHVEGCLFSFDFGRLIQSRSLSVQFETLRFLWNLVKGPKEIVLALLDTDIMTAFAAAVPFTTLCTSSVVRTDWLADVLKILLDPATDMYSLPLNTPNSELRRTLSEKVYRNVISPLLFHLQHVVVVRSDLLPQLSLLATGSWELLNAITFIGVPSRVVSMLGEMGRINVFLERKIIQAIRERAPGSVGEERRRIKEWWVRLNQEGIGDILETLGRDCSQLRTLNGYTHQGIAAPPRAVAEFQRFMVETRMESHEEGSKSLKADVQKKNDLMKRKNEKGVTEKKYTRQLPASGAYVMEVKKKTESGKEEDKKED
ncbi:hypothetical protein BLNAU_12253 [Blattamonas nauphoetae]|uniref:Uncharacterized protein n=1 Tax=Blattamonas nauphoetae TaxID=2049346 RepID=A0ABQ9XNJ5_9EUKA|nr:hypothetical protein BLNAU_12253 [Blattamonas nauphoetae]